MNSTHRNSTIKSCNLDDTSIVLRKAMLHNLMINPTIFRGGKDDVIKWLEDLEHLFEVAHIPDANKLDLVSYTLRGEALQWYRNSKSTFTSWSTFVSELKKTFVSVYHDELAFKKLESYIQTENQSICNFYTEVIKLCNDADPNMSESTKLKNLLNKTKPTIQFEVRRKKPTTTKEFFAYAKEVEELYQLTNLNTNVTFNPNTISTTIISPPATTLSNSNNPPRSHAITSHSSNWKKPDADYHSQYNNNNYRSSTSVPHSNSFFRSQQPVSSSNTRPNPSPAQSSSSSNLNRQKPLSQHNRNHGKSSNNPQHSRLSPRNNSTQHNINSLMYSDNNIPFVPNQQSLSSDYCTQDKPKDPPLQSSSNF
jgi:hypothetical protein